MNDLKLKVEQVKTDLEAVPDTDTRRRIAVLNRLAWELSDTDTRQAYERSQQALDLASALPPGEPAAQAGIALSLRTLGYLNMRFGQYPEAFSQLTRALGAAETAAQRGTPPADLTEGLPDLYDGLAAIYVQIGSLPEALEFMYKQLAAAEHNCDRPRIANAYNNLANVYLAMEQNQRAFETLQRALQIAGECGHTRIECIAHLNLAEMHLMGGDYEAAASHGRQGLQRSRHAGFELFEIYAHKTLGKVQQALANPEQSQREFSQALAASRQLNSPVSETEILLELGRSCRSAGRLDEALAHLRQAEAIATGFNGRGELIQTHLLLAETYEQIGDTAQALAHYKQGQQIKEQLTGEKVNLRLQVLQVAHDTEVARKEAAQLRALTEGLEVQVAIRTAELTETVALLQQEIAQRVRAEAEIKAMVATLEHRVAARTEELAAFFDLIPLAGQDGDLAGLFAQILLRIMEITRSRALCLHLFDADQRALRLAGQQHIAGAAWGDLEVVWPGGDFQRWLQRPNAPLLVIDPHIAVQVPAALALTGYRTYLGAQIKIAGRTEGLLSCYRATDRGYGIDEIALVTALAEQIGTLLETRRLRRQAEEMAILAERQRLARDLHDSVTQSLYSLTLFSRAGREAAADGDAARLHESLTALEHNTLHALREMRLLLYELRPADLAREGLQRALELRLNTVERRAGLRLAVEFVELPPLPPAYELDLYHVLVEALNNIVKHAAATQVTLRLELAGDCLRLLVADDGQGFDPRLAPGGLGLRNMRERVARLGGELAISSTPAGGTTVTASLPLPAGD